MFPSTKTLATLSLLSVAGLCSRCEDTSGVCLTSFRWCDSSPCEYPDNVYPLYSELDRNTGYAMIDESENYTLTWVNAPGEVEVLWRISSRSVNNREGKHAEWSKNVTEDHLTFSPGAVYRDILDSGDFNVSRADLQALTADMRNSIAIIDHSGELQPVVSRTSTFSVQRYWAGMVAQAQEEIGRNQERHKWKLGVGIGVGLGVPVMMALSALVTWFVMRKKAKRQAPVVKQSS